MKKLVISMAMSILCIAVFAACSLEKEKEVVPEYVLTYAENQSENYPTTQGAYYFAELVKEQTEGKVVIRVKHSGELGTQEDVVNQLQFGGIDLTRVSISAISDELPRMNVLQLPFLYETKEQMWNVLESEVGQSFLNSLEQIDLVGLSWYEAGTRGFYAAEEPIESIEDLQGKVVRVQDSAMMKDWIEMLGGTPVVVPYTDIYSAFEVGKIDVAENNWSSYHSEKHYEVAKYYTMEEHTRVPELQLMSRNTWDKLPVVYRNIITQCARKSAEYEKELWDEYSENAKAEAIKNGCVVTSWSKEEVQKCKDMIDPLYEKYCATYMYLIKEIQEKNYEIH